MHNCRPLWCGLWPVFIQQIETGGNLTPRCLVKVKVKDYKLFRQENSKLCYYKTCLANLIARQSKCIKGHFCLYFISVPT